MSEKNNDHYKPGLKNFQGGSSLCKLALEDREQMTYTVRISPRLARLLNKVEALIEQHLPKNVTTKLDKGEEIDS